MANNPWFLTWQEIHDQLQSFLPPSWRATLPGKVLGRLLVAYSLSMESVYALLARVLRLSIVATSEREWLRALVSGFSMETFGGIPATGVIRFGIWRTVDSVVIIPINTRVGSVSGSTFATKEPAIIPIGETFVDVSAYCTIPGSAGNSASGEVSALLTSNAGIDWVTNPNAFLGGSDAEADAAIKARLPLHLEGLHRATIPATEYVARDLERFPELLGFATFRNYGTAGYIRAVATEQSGGSLYRAVRWESVGGGVYYVATGLSSIQGVVAAGWPGIRFGIPQREASGAEVWEASGFVAEVEAGDWRWSHDTNTGRLYARADGRDLNSLQITLQAGVIWALQRELEDQWVANGVHIDVLSPFPVSAVVSLSYGLELGYNQTNVEANLRLSVSGYVGSLQLGQDFTLEGLYSSLSVVPGASGVLILAPAGNISVPSDSVFRLSVSVQIAKRAE